MGWKKNNSSWGTYLEKGEANQQENYRLSEKGAEEWVGREKSVARASAQVNSSEDGGPDTPEASLTDDGWPGWNSSLHEDNWDNSESGYTSHVIEVRVGPHSTSFQVHKAILFKSAVIAKAWNRCVSDVNDLFHHVSARYFDLLLQFLYQGTYKSACTHMALEDMNDVQRLFEFGTHAELYCLAGQLELPDLTGMAIAKMEACGSLPFRSFMGITRHVYPSLPPNDGFFRDRFRKETLRALAETKDLAEQPWIVDIFYNNCGPFAADLFKFVVEFYTTGCARSTDMTIPSEETPVAVSDAPGPEHMPDAKKDTLAISTLNVTMDTLDPRELEVETLSQSVTPPNEEQVEIADLKQNDDVERDSASIFKTPSTKKRSPFSYAQLSSMLKPIKETIACPSPPLDEPVAFPSPPVEPDCWSIPPPPPDEAPVGQSVNDEADDSGSWGMSKKAKGKKKKKGTLVEPDCWSIPPSPSAEAPVGQSVNDEADDSGSWGMSKKAKGSEKKKDTSTKVQDCKVADLNSEPAPALEETVPEIVKDDLNGGGFWGVSNKVKSKKQQQKFGSTMKVQDLELPEPSEAFAGTPPLPPCESRSKHLSESALWQKCRLCSSELAEHAKRLALE